MIISTVRCHLQSPDCPHLYTQSKWKFKMEDINFIVPSTVQLIQDWNEMIYNYISPANCKTSKPLNVFAVTWPTGSQADLPPFYLVVGRTEAPFLTTGSEPTERHQRPCRTDMAVYAPPPPSMLVPLFLPPPYTEPFAS